MTRRLAPLLALLLAASSAAGQETAAAPSVKLPATKAVAVGERFSIAPQVTNGGTPRLYLPDPGLKEDRTFVDLLPEEYQAKLKGWVLYASAPGSFRVCSYVGGPGNSCSEIAVCTVTVGDAPPAPPGPTPGPTPPGPTPGPAPIPGNGLHVLIVTESSDLSKLPASQVNTIMAASVRAYLNEKCPKEGSKSWPAWRVWDKDVNPAAEDKVWQDAFARPRKSVPWVVISNGKAGFEGPLPATPDEFLKLLRTYGG